MCFSENEETFFSDYFSKLAEVERKLDVYIRDVSAMFDEKSLDLAELTMRTHIVALPINDAMQMSEAYLDCVKVMLLPPASATHSDRLIHLLDDDLKVLLFRMTNIEGIKLRHHDGGVMSIVKNDSLKVICDGADGNFTHVLKGLYETSQLLSYNLRQIVIAYSCIDPESVTTHFDAIYRDYCKSNAYVISEILDEVKDPSVAITNLNRDFGGEVIVKLWKRLKSDIPALIAELRRQNVSVKSLDTLFDFRIRYEQLVLMNSTFDIHANTVSINNAHIGSISSTGVIPNEHNRTRKADKCILAKDQSKQDVVITRLKEMVAGKTGKDAAFVFKSFLFAGYILPATYTQFTNTLGKEILCKTDFYDFVGEGSKVFTNEQLKAFADNIIL